MTTSIAEMLYQNYLANRYKFTARPTATAFGYGTALITDLGIGLGSRWECDGTNWKPVGGHVTLATLAARVSVAGAGVETIAHQFQLPAGLLTTLDRIRLIGSISKAGTTTTGTLTVRIGTAGTTSDTAITGTGGAVLAAGSRSSGYIYDLLLRSATTIEKTGSGSNANPSYGTGAGALAYNAATTISNVSNSLWVSVTITPGATDAVAIEDNQIILVTS